MFCDCFVTATGEDDEKLIQKVLITLHESSMDKSIENSLQNIISYQSIVLTNLPRYTQNLSRIPANQFLAKQ